MGITLAGLSNTHVVLAKIFFYSKIVLTNKVSESINARATDSTEISPLVPILHLRESSTSFLCYNNVALNEVDMLRSLYGSILVCLCISFLHFFPD